MEKPWGSPSGSGEDLGLGLARALATSSTVRGLVKDGQEVCLRTLAIVEEDTGLRVNREPQ